MEKEIKETLFSEKGENLVRAKRGASGALYLQSAQAGPNSWWEVISFDRWSK